MKKLLALVAIVCVSGGGVADTLTWRGTEGGGDGATFTDAANWQNENGEAQAPTSGDTLVFNAAATITSPIDLGNVGYTFQCNAEVTLNALISGAGKLTKDGTAKLTINNRENTYTGGTLILNGQVYKNGSFVSLLGSGPLEIQHTSGKNPNLEIYSSPLTNDIYITGIDGSVSKMDFGLCQNAYLAGNIFAECDFTVKDRYNVFRTPQESGISGTVNAHGHTMYLTGRDEYPNTRMRLSGTFDCSTYKDTTVGTVFTSGKFIDVDASYSFNAGTNVFDGDVYIACTNITFSQTTVDLRVGIPFNPEATVKLSDGAKFTGSGSAAVKELIVNGESVARGIYTADNLPEVIEGSAAIYVDCYNVWTGAVDDRWNTPLNWSLGRAPGAGDVAAFTNKVAVTINADKDEIVNIDEKELIIQVNSPTVYWYGSFQGSGAIVKRGSGALRFHNANAYTGGTRVLAGEMWALVHNSFGTGDIVIDRTSALASVVFNGNEKDTNKLYIIGPYRNNEHTIQYGNSSGFGGEFIGNGSTFGIHSRYCSASSFCTVIGNVSNPGGWVQLTAEMKDWPCNLEIRGNIDANVNVISGNTPIGSRMKFTGRLVDEDATFEMNACTNILESTAYVACTNIIVNDEKNKLTNLKIRAPEAINPDATLYITNNATVEVDGNFTVYLRSLVINGERLGKGAYSAHNYPGVIFGEGRLRVGVPGLKILLR